MVVHGESGTGKTVWARWLFGDPQFVLEVNCASCPEPDLRDLDPLLHKAILYDEASPEMVLRQKKVVPGTASECAIGLLDDELPRLRRVRQRRGNDHCVEHLGVGCRGLEEA